MRRLALVLALVLAAPAPALAQECPRTSLADIEDEVMCLICGTPLALVDDEPQAERQRAFIQRLVDDCRSKDEIKRALVAQYGESVLALPGDEGDDSVGDVLVYVVPAVAVLLGVAGVAFAVLRWRRPVARRSSFGQGSKALDEDMERYDL